MKARRVGATPAAAEQARPGELPAAPPGAGTQGKARGILGSNSGTEITSEELRRMIANAAYLRAEKRGFAGGHELEDWLQAEAEVRSQLGQAGS